MPCRVTLKISEHIELQLLKIKETLRSQGKATLSKADLRIKRLSKTVSRLQVPITIHKTEVSHSITPCIPVIHTFKVKVYKAIKAFKAVKVAKDNLHPANRTIISVINKT